MGRTRAMLATVRAALKALPNNPRALYAAVEIDEAIPTGHYQAVAKIIGFVLSQARRRAARIRPMSAP